MAKCFVFSHVKYFLCIPKRRHPSRRDPELIPSPPSHHGHHHHRSRRPWGPGPTRQCSSSPVIDLASPTGAAEAGAAQIQGPPTGHHSIAASRDLANMMPFLARRRQRTARLINLHCEVSVRGGDRDSRVIVGEARRESGTRRPLVMVR